MSIYEVNNKPTIEKMMKYDEDNYTYYRFQEKDWEMGTQYWGMSYESAEDAIEHWEDDGLTPEEAVLNGKSCCDTAHELLDYCDRFDKDFRVLVLTGNYVEEGHDGESVVDVDEILEIWDYNDFIKVANEMEEE